MRMCRPHAFRAGTALPLLATTSLFCLAFPVQAQYVNPDLKPYGTPKVPNTHQSPPVTQPNNEVVAFLKPGTNPLSLAQFYGLQPIARLKSDSNAVLFRASSVQMAQMATVALRRNAQVRYVFQNQRTRVVKSQFVPNDPYFGPNNPEVGWPGQWYLKNAFVPGRDANVTGAWNRNLTGQGVLIGIVDEGVQVTHPDLAPNFNATNSYNFVDGNSDPSPTGDFENHGTAVAGIAAASGGNGIGITGVAPLAQFAALRLELDDTTTENFVDATTYNSNSANAPISVKNHSYSYELPYTNATDESNAISTSASFGTIHVFAAGNARGNMAEDTNKSMLLTNPDAICVAAMGSNGVFADYSNFGANVFVAAPSDSGMPYCYGVLSTDRTGADGYNTGEFNPPDATDLFSDADYTSIFHGTSVSAPIVAGVMALGKQIQPALNVRFAKQLLALSSTPVHLTDKTTDGDGGWKTNAAGYKFNPNYGFGLINADLFTQLASVYTGVTTQTVETTALTTVSKAIPDYTPSGTGVTQTFTINSTGPLEVVRIYLNIAHPYRGDIEAYLTSPSGTKSRVAMRSFTDSGANINWWFTSNAFWGENPAGTWKLQVIDTQAPDGGTWNSFQAEVRTGRLVAVPSITTLSPAKVPTGSAATTLTVNGKGFLPSSYVTFNGTPLATQFVAWNKLTATIPASSLTAAGAAQVQVVTPSPTTTSNTATFGIGSALTITVLSPATRVGNEIQISVRVKNVGATDASGVRIRSAVLYLASTNTTYTATNLPVSYGIVPINTAEDGVLKFSGDQVPAGTKLRLRFTLAQIGAGDIFVSVPFTAP